MQTVSYVANGKATTFYFNFPYFDRDNIVVTVNGVNAPSYNLIGTKGGTAPDFPFTSGKIVFQKPPKRYDTITIERHLPLVRAIDFQPTAQITPTLLNQDMNYTMEVLKDLRADLDIVRQNYADIADKESTELLLSKINLVNQNIADVSDNIEILNSISSMQNAIASLQGTVATLASALSGCTTDIDLLNTKTTGISDYVIESQAPSAANNYTWYRKYKSGWVEQGGQIAPSNPTNTNTVITLPVEMTNTNYGAFSNTTYSGNDAPLVGNVVKAKTTVSISLGHLANYTTNWLVFGMM